MVKIKTIFPKQWYTLRKVKIIHDGETIGKIGHMETFSLDSFSGSLKMSLDYHNVTLKTSSSTETKYYILFLQLKSSFIASLLSLMFKNCLALKAVSKNAFENCTAQEVYNQSPIPKAKITFSRKIILGVFFLYATFILAFPFWTNLLQEDLKGIAFIIGLGGVITSLVLLLRNHSETAFVWRSGMLSLSMMAFPFLTDLGLEMKAFIVLIILSLCFILIFNENDKPLPTKSV